MKKLLFLIFIPLILLGQYANYGSGKTTDIITANRWEPFPPSATSQASIGTNATRLWRVTVPVNISTDSVSCYVLVASPGDSAYVAVYNSSGARVAVSDSVQCTGTGLKTMKMELNITPGEYYVGWAQSGTTLQMLTFNNSGTRLVKLDDYGYVTIVGGAIAKSITPSSIIKSSNVHQPCLYFFSGNIR